MGLPRASRGDGGLFPCTTWAVRAGCALSAGTGTVSLPPEPPAAGEGSGAITMTHWRF